jgi:arylsulfatase A-like enzyme
VDRAVDHLLRAIRQRGLYDESLIVFTVDHGEMNTREALVDKGVYLCPDVLRVPLYVKPPKSWNAGRREVEAPVSHLDIAPTLLEVAGIEPMARLDGQSLVPQLKGAAPEANRELLFECGWHVGVNFACGMQRWSPGGEHWLYAHNCSDEFDELYDLTTAEPTNLAPDRGRRKAYLEMVEYMAAFLERDPRWRGYWHTFRLDRYHDLPHRDATDVQMLKPV